MKTKHLLFAVPLLLGACASPVPDAIRLDVGEPLSVAQVQQAPQASRGKLVRWGGEILAVKNFPNHSDVVVLRRDLHNDGEPRPTGGEAKRFIARLPGFVDPAEFAAEQRITVAGKIVGVVVLTVGEYRYPHPVVEVQESYRWAKFEPLREPPWHSDPFYCDPFVPWGWGYRRPYCW